MPSNDVTTKAGRPRSCAGVAAVRWPPLSRRHPREKGNGSPASGTGGVGIGVGAGVAVGAVVGDGVCVAAGGWVGVGDLAQTVGAEAEGRADVGEGSVSAVDVTRGSSATGGLFAGLHPASAQPASTSPSSASSSGRRIVALAFQDNAEKVAKNLAGHVVVLAVADGDQFVDVVPLLDQP